MCKLLSSVILATTFYIGMLLSSWRGKSNNVWLLIYYVYVKKSLEIFPKLCLGMLSLVSLEENSILCIQDLLKNMSKSPLPLNHNPHSYCAPEATDKWWRSDATPPRYSSPVLPPFLVTKVPQLCALHLLWGICGTSPLTWMCSVWQAFHPPIATSQVNFAVVVKWSM